MEAQTESVPDLIIKPKQSEKLQSKLPE